VNPHAVDASNSDSQQRWEDDGGAIPLDCGSTTSSAVCVLHGPASLGASATQESGKKASWRATGVMGSRKKISPASSTTLARSGVLL
jgi:hypothetical protein